MTHEALSANFPDPGSDSTSEPRKGGSVDVGVAGVAVTATPDPRPRPAPIDTSWVTTEPNYKPGLADWILAGVLAAALLAGVGFGVWAIAEVTR